MGTFFSTHLHHPPKMLGVPKDIVVKLFGVLLSIATSVDCARDICRRFFKPESMHYPTIKL